MSSGRGWSWARASATRSPLSLGMAMSQTTTSGRAASGLRLFEDNPGLGDDLSGLGEVGLQGEQHLLGQFQLPGQYLGAVVHESPRYGVASRDSMSGRAGGGKREGAGLGQRRA